MQISFYGNNINHIPKKPQKEHTSSEAKKNTVAILGSSKNTDAITDYLDMCSNVTRALVLGNKNIVSGCGSQGIMGRAYYCASENSRVDQSGKPAQNLAILTEPLWGDEDLENCIPVSTANSEAERIEQFCDVSDNFVIFAGGPGSLQEATTLISKNYYSKDKKQIILVGKDFFKGLKDQYDKLYESGLINCRPEQLFQIADSEDEVLNKLLPH